MFYKLLGWVTWKAIRRYARNKVPRGVVAGAVVVLGILALSAAAKLRGGDE